VFKAAAGLLPEDTNNFNDIYVHDRLNGALELISSGSNAEPANYHSTTPVISGDGRYIAFASAASNLLPGTPGIMDIYVYDRQNETMERASVDNNGTQGNGASQEPFISYDGRYVAFVSTADNLVVNDLNASRDVFVRDRLTGTTRIIAYTSAASDSNSPAISDDGRYIAFLSTNPNLVPADTNNTWDVFVHDIVAGTTEMISVDPNGNCGNDTSLDGHRLGISGDGRFVSFASAASNLVAGDTNGTWDIFLRDRFINATERVSLADGGSQANGASYEPSISGNGRYISFRSDAANLVAGDTNGTTDIFVRDTTNLTTTRVNTGNCGIQADRPSGGASISNNGRFVAFNSIATNLAVSDTNNGRSDIFVKCYLCKE